jgi:hypothetical protein
MDRFENIVLGIALVLLILALTVMGISMAKQTGTAKEPAACPDFWYSSYFEPCSMTEQGCCPDGVTAANEDGSSCNATPCSLSPGGCCPDGVTAMVDPSKCPAAASKCYNVNKMGENGLESMDFTTDEYMGTQGLCKKQNWAKMNGLNWDGVSNVANAC